MVRLFALVAVCALPVAAAEPAHLHVETVPSQVAVTLDGVLVGLSPRTEAVAPGVHTVVLERPGAPAVSFTLTLSAGEARTLRFDLTPAPRAATVPLAGVVTTLGGLAVLTGGLLLRFDAEAHAREVEQLARLGGVWDERALALQRAGFAAQTWSWALVTAGGLVSLAGLITALTQVLHADTPAPRLTLSPLAGGAFVSWSLGW